MTMDTSVSVPSAPSGTVKRKRAVRRSAQKKNGSRKSPNRASRGNGHSTQDYLSRSRDSVLRRGKRMIDKSYEWADDASRSVPSISKNFRWPRSTDFGVLSKASPLILGAIGVGIGLAVWTLVPHSSSSGNNHQATRRSRRSPGGH